MSNEVRVLDVNDGSLESNTPAKDKPPATEKNRKITVAGAEEKSEEEKKKEEEAKPAKFMELFRFADGTDKALMVIGSLVAVVIGAGLPGFTFAFGELLDEIGTAQIDPNFWVWLMLILGGAMWLCAWVSISCWTITGDRQTSKMKLELFTAVLRQEVGWYDKTKTGQIITMLNSDSVLIEKAISDKMAHLIKNLSTFVFAFGFAFYREWRLTLMMLAVVPFLAASGAMLGKILQNATAKGQEAYGKAGNVAQEVLSSIRTVHAFNGCQREVKRYEDALVPCEAANIRKGILNGLNMGVLMMLVFSSYALAFWYGSLLIGWTVTDEKPITGGTIVSVFFAVLIGAFELGNAGPIVGTISVALGAARIFENLIDREPEIITEAGKGKTIPNLKGKIEFRDISFRYPMREEAPIFNKFNLTVNPSEEVALVGHSGSGKSSVVSLIERFYDPHEGKILIDDVPLKELDLVWWRSQVAIVTQEPTLFTATVMQNIKAARPDATDEEVHEACKDAFIHDVIVNLPMGYDTPVGEGGSQLSGGQKQRVAIARAIIRKPKVLLLDEATSALDRESEILVQKALAKIMKDRTTVVIAHRLVTIQDANNICFIKPRNPDAAETDADFYSTLAEQGTHSDLMAKDGLYAEMVKSQQKSEDSSESSPLNPQASGPGMQQAMEQLTKKTSMKKVTEGVPIEMETEDKKKDDAEKKEKAPLMRIAKMNAPEWPWIVIGCFFAIICGSSYPIYAILFARIISIFSFSATFPDGTVNQVALDKMQDDAALFSLLFVGLGVLNLIANAGVQSAFGIAAEKLTTRLRKQLFNAMIRMQPGWYDLPGNESGALTATLASDTEQVHHLWGTSIGKQFQAYVCLLAGLTIAFVSSYKLTLVTLSTVPLMILGGYMNMKVLAGFSDGTDKEMAKASQTVAESITGCRTVFAFNMQSAQRQMYAMLLEAPLKKAKKKGLSAGFFFGFSQFTMYGAFALGFWYGARLIATGDIDIEAMMRALMAVMMGGMGFGEVYSMGGDTAEASNAAVRSFKIIDATPEFDAMSAVGEVVINMNPVMDFQSVQFQYPSRPEVPILKRLNLAIKPGQRVALLGATGCGKSTIISLLMRFYDPAEGVLNIDNATLAGLNLQEWRKRIGYVQQEPVLFDNSLEYNIRYSNPDATDDEVCDAAKKANIHETIMGLPDEYKTNVGPKGSQLSGGQKQRIAIARSILNKPSLLLLDEATSALDNQSEKEVQAALDHIIETDQMTVVMVAHRMTTIHNCNHIIVMNGGEIKEMGTHDELYALNGEYRRRYDQYYQKNSS